MASLSRCSRRGHQLADAYQRPPGYFYAYLSAPGFIVMQTPRITRTFHFPLSIVGTEINLEHEFQGKMNIIEKV